MNEVNNREIQKKSRKATIVIVLLTIIIIFLGGYILIDKLVLEKDSEIDKEKTSMSTTTTMPVINSTTKKAELNVDELISLIKEHYKTENLYNETNTEFWNITDLTYLGYMEENSNAKYYIATGSYKCKNGGSDCIYVAQSSGDEEESETHHYKGGVVIKDDKVTEALSPMFENEVVAGEVPNFIKVNQKLK